MRSAIAVVAFCIWGAAGGGAADPPLEFEAASIHVAPASGPGHRMTGCFGGLGSSTPGIYRCADASVRLMALQAYNLKSYQLPSSQDDDADATVFDVTAKVPRGATPEQVKAMLRNLLAERFKLAFHYQEKEVKGYELLIAKSGLKMAETAPADAPPAAPKPVKDADGFVYIPGVRNYIQTAQSGGLTRWVGNNISVDWLSAWLVQLGCPVVDSTGAQG